MSSQKLDVFPGNPSDRVPVLEYPDFRRLASEREVFYFICYLDESKRIYFKQVDANESQIQYVGKETLTFNRAKYEEKTWSWAARKLNRPTAENLRKNADQRLGFKYDKNVYLVKSCFTFGQRKVAPGTVHVIQLLNVPVSFYFVDRRNKQNITLRNKIFNQKEEFKYCKRTLRAKQRYRILPGTTYVLFTIQKCLFSLHIVDENMQLPFPCLEPIRDEERLPRRPQKSDSLYLKPVPTPFIEDAGRTTTTTPPERMPPPPATERGSSRQETPERMPPPETAAAAAAAAAAAPEESSVEPPEESSAAPETPAPAERCPRDVPAAETRPAEAAAASPRVVYDLRISYYPAGREVVVVPQPVTRWYQGLKNQTFPDPKARDLLSQLDWSDANPAAPLDLTCAKKSEDDANPAPLDLRHHQHQQQQQQQQAADMLGVFDYDEELRLLSDDSETNFLSDIEMDTF